MMLVKHPPSSSLPSPRTVANKPRQTVQGPQIIKRLNVAGTITVNEELVVLEPFLNPLHSRTVPDILISSNIYIKGVSCPTVHCIVTLVSASWFVSCVHCPPTLHPLLFLAPGQARVMDGRPGLVAGRWKVLL